MQGGAISAITGSLNPSLSKFVVKSTRFINNTAENAGAIYVSNHIMEIRNSYFELNRATKRDGGSLYLECP